jgi:O-succinylbenzoic acid--CoA ligase
VNRLVVVEAVGAPFVDALRRAWDAGDAVLPLDPRLPAPARRAVLAAAEPDRPIEPGDALVVATSGTDGAPKAVVLTHAAVAASAQATSQRLGIDPATDRWLACLPLAHVGGLSVVTRALHTGTPLVVHDGFDAEAVTSAVKDGCTRTSLVPTALARLDATAWRTILVGGQAAPAQRPANVVATYGMTETGSGIAYDGHPLDGVELRVTADGELEVRGPMLLRAYRDGTDPRSPDGWLATGDLGTVDGGVVTVAGRRGDLIITGGENVWPASVERVLAGHPGVAEVAVVGRADPEWGQRVVAVVVPADASAPPTLDDLRSWAKAELPAYAAPRDLELRTALPRTTLGKIRRRELG